MAMPAEPAVYLERVAARGLRSVVNLNRSLEESVAESLTGFPVRLAEAPVFSPPAATALTIQVEMSAGLAGQRFQYAGLPEDPRIRGEKDWEVTAFLEVDEEGRVRHVLLESPSQSDRLNALMVRTLLRWRMAPAKTSRDGRVTLRWMGRPPWPESSPNTGSP